MSTCEPLVSAFSGIFGVLLPYALLMIATDGEFLISVVGALVAAAVIVWFGVYVVMPMVCS
jgi:hypothetical protein